MLKDRISRRNALKGIGSTVGSLFFLDTYKTYSEEANKTTNPKTKFIFCLNTGTIRGQKLSLDKEVDIAAKAGYNAIEPWVESIQRFKESGGSLKDLAKKISDLGLSVESAIAFPEWIVDDENRRRKGIENLKYSMDLVSQISGKRIAVPPAGATNIEIPLDIAVERYKHVLEISEDFGVIPQLELWGFSKTIHLLGQAMYVVIESGHKNACVLADVFHMYKGGSNFNGLAFCGGSAIQVFHMNDYPSTPPRQEINDSFRVMPGDGVAPLTQILQCLNNIGGIKVLSLELFNQEYWKMDPLETAKIGLSKMRNVVATVISN
jgi:sugar phosphate isomerase/epimerase